MTIDQRINKLFLSVAISVIGWGVTRVDNINESINRLNTQIAIVVSQVATHNHLLENHEDRIHDIEKNKYGGNKNGSRN